MCGSRRVHRRVAAHAWVSLLLAMWCLLSGVGRLWAADGEPIPVDSQPFYAAVERLIAALDELGFPLSAEVRTALEVAMKQENRRIGVREVQRVLDRRVLANVVINPESRVSATAGSAARELIEQGWRVFLIKVHNQAGITPELRMISPQALPLVQRGKGERQKPGTTDGLPGPNEAANRFLDVHLPTSPPLSPKLSGLECEYRVAMLYSRDRGPRDATFAFDVGQGTQDLAHRNEVSLLFQCAPSCDVTLTVRDEAGRPTTAAFEFRDRQRRVFPNPARRLAPDFFFHDQVYRADGESVRLPAGEYSVRWSRGPEYLPEQREIVVPAGAESHGESFALRRWIHPKARGWFSGDHHVHAAGCAHYDSPTEGVAPADMLRHIVGEDLNVGCVLSWGPCWYHQKQYFEGRASSLSQPEHLMRYDVEVSGFPSSHAGHLCLLRLAEDDYPGANVIEDWPSWTQPVLAWCRRQGGVAGYSHSGWGLALPDVMPDGSRKFPGQMWGGAPPNWDGLAASQLPDFAMPKFDGIGANEFVVTVANGECDFLSAVDTPAVWELNVWYHVLNAGLRPRISGETDFPCIYGERVGLGRAYVKLPARQPLDFDQWAEGIRLGRSYCCDGLSHLLDFRVNDVAVGEPGTDGAVSTLKLPAPGNVRATVDAAALLAAASDESTERIRKSRLDVKPYWHIERARVEGTRQVPVELIVNGRPVERTLLQADGATKALSFSTEISKSSWVALRIFPSCHTNPVWVEVAGQPVRPDRESARWCRDAVDVCWQSKQGRIRDGERDAAKAAYDAARSYYATIVDAP